VSKPLFKMSEGQWLCYWRGLLGWGGSVQEAFDCLLKVCDIVCCEPPRRRIDWKPGWFV